MITYNLVGLSLGDQIIYDGRTEFSSSEKETIVNYLKAYIDENSVNEVLEKADKESDEGRFYITSLAGETTNVSLAIERVGAIYYIDKVSINNMFTTRDKWHLFENMRNITNKIRAVRDYEKITVEKMNDDGTIHNIAQIDVKEKTIEILGKIEDKEEANAINKVIQNYCPELKILLVNIEGDSFIPMSL